MNCMFYVLTGGLKASYAARGFPSVTRQLLVSTVLAYTVKYFFSFIYAFICRWTLQGQYEIYRFGLVKPTVNPPIGNRCSSSATNANVFRDDVIM